MAQMTQRLTGSTTKHLCREVVDTCVDTLVIPTKLQSSPSFLVVPVSWCVLQSKKNLKNHTAAAVEVPVA